MDEDVAHVLGMRIRAVRWQRGWNQAAVAEAAGTSKSVIGRMELGEGGTVTLGTWLRVADVLGLPPLTWPGHGIPFGVALQGLTAVGGWRPAGFAGDAVLLDRDPRPVETLRYVQRPAERAVLRAIPILTDPDREWDHLFDVITDVRRSAPAGRLVSGSLVVVRNGANTRVAGPMRRRSDGLWIRTLRDPSTSMPYRRGWVWLEPRGTHLLSVG